MTVEQTRRLELLGSDISRELALTLDEMIARLEVLEAERRADTAERRRLRVLTAGLTEHNDVLSRREADLYIRVRMLDARVRKLEGEAEVPLSARLQDESMRAHRLVQAGAVDPRD